MVSLNYLEYFGLEREPFSNAPDERFFFSSNRHTHALKKLHYAIDSSKGLAMLVGGIGTGKTTLARRLFDRLPAERYESALLVMVHSGITPEWILTRIALQLGVSTPAEDRLVLLRQLYERLLQIDQQGRQAVVLIDEAQMLQSREIMEEFRGLLNLEIPGRKLLNILFFGLPELDENLRLDPPLAQRVALRCHLRSFTADMTEAYIKHRLQVANAPCMLFEQQAIRQLYRYAGGIPRLINTLCDNSLLEAALQGCRRVTTELVAQAAFDLGLSGEDLPIGEVVQSESEEIESLLDRLEVR